MIRWLHFCMPCPGPQRDFFPFAYFNYRLLHHRSNEWIQSSFASSSGKCRCYMEAVSSAALSIPLPFVTTGLVIFHFFFFLLFSFFIFLSLSLSLSLSLFPFLSLFFHLFMNDRNVRAAHTHRHASTHASSLNA